MKRLIDSTSEAESLHFSVQQGQQVFGQGSIQKQLYFTTHCIAQNEYSEISVNLMILKLNPLKFNKHIDLIIIMFRKD